MHPRSYRLKFPEPAPSAPVESLPGSSATPAVLRVRPVSPPPKGPPEGPGGQAALHLEPRELWIAAHVPQLTLLAQRRPDDTRPVVIVDAEDHNPRLLDVDARAQAAGIRPGMTLGAALAAAPDIDRKSVV